MPKRLLALGSLAFVLCAPARAVADVSSWVSVSAGPSFIDEGTGMESQAALSFQAGMGTTPSNPLVLGGSFHLETHFGRGTDLGILARLATRGFVLGDWGGALDFGGYERFWGVGSEGGIGALVLGAPWGLTLRGEAAIGTNEARSFGIVLGVDFARLTVFRRSGLDWFPNPYPGHTESK